MRAEVPRNGYRAAEESRCEGCVVAVHREFDLPYGGVDRPPRFLTRSPAFHQILLGTAVLLAGGLMVAALLVVPRPDIRLSDARYFPASCDVSNRTRVVTATFILTNTGGGTGSMEVDLFADSTRLTSDVVFEVPARSSVPGTLAGVVHDCSDHAYSLSASYPSYGG